MTTLRFHNRAIVVADPQLERTLERAAKAAQSSLPVLVVGESGTGKELIARFIHEKSKRSKGRFVSVNCAAIPEGLMEAELFGYERGAFTGAIQQRIGKFEQASGGTLLMDEISEMPWALQAKLLRVLQEGEIDRLGAREAVTINTRVIATTNRDPSTLVKESSFRADLYYRLNVIRIECAPLRGRYAAIVELARAFLAASEQGQERPKLHFSSAALARLNAHLWPGNIRELKNAVERAALNCEGLEIQPEHFEGLESLELSVDSAPRRLADLEKRHILDVLKDSAGNRTEAAKELGISIRTLRNKLKEFQAP